MGANGVTTPGENAVRGQQEENEVELGPAEATNYRSIAARANYLAADRPDIMYAVKELCRGMAKPTKIGFTSNAWVDTLSRAAGPS